MVLFKKNQEYLTDAKNAAEIVQKGLQRNNLSKMNELLVQIAPKNQREQFVFDSPGCILNYLIIAACVLALLGSLYFLLLGIAVLMFSVDFISIVLAGISSSTAIIIISCLLFIREVKYIRFERRYKTYAQILTHQRIILIDDLAILAGTEKNMIFADLDKAIKYKYIPQGHWGSKNRFFMVSDSINKAYLSNQSEYDYYFRKQVEERMRIFDRTPEVKKLLSEGASYVESIHNCNAVIHSKAVSDKLSQMERIVSMIFHEVEVNPKQASKLGLLLEYYLPTTEKLLDAYIGYDDSGTDNKTAEKSKFEIESSLASINTAFESILDRFYQDKELELSSDIDAMKKMMCQEGLTVQEG